MINTNWNQLREDHETAYLRADICLGSPESYSLDEKRRICEDMASSTAEIDAAMRADFESLPPQAQARMLELLAGADPGNMEFWREVLGLKMPDAPPEAI